MILPLALEQLTLTGRLQPGEDWGPMATDFATYAEFAAAWRGTSAVPTLAELETAWATYLTAHPEFGLSKRSLLAIRADIVALTNAQKTAIWTALTTGSPPRWSTDVGPNAAALAVIQMLGSSGSLSAADVLEAKIRAATFYAQDNPAFLVHPSFDPTINVPSYA
jgi:hypothetical protein